MSPSGTKRRSKSSDHDDSSRSSGAGTVGIVHGLHAGRTLRPLERRLEVEDRADRLPGDDPAGREAAPVADAVDLVADRLGVRHHDG